MLNKKAQTMNGSVATFIFLILGIGVATISMIFFGTMNGTTYQLSESLISEIGDNDVVNHSVTFAVPNRTYYMGHSFIQEGTLNVVNLSSGADVGNGNLTVDYELGIAYTKKNLYNKTALGLTYTWGAKEVRENIIDSSINGFEVMENTSSYSSLVVLALVIGIIFAIILGVASTSGIGGSRGGGSL